MNTIGFYKMNLGFRLIIALMMFFMCYVLSVNAADITTGLVSYWSLDGHMRDPVGWRDGVFPAGNFDWVEGRSGQAIKLNGSQYIHIPNFSLTTNTVTFVAWINGWKQGDWAGIVVSRSGDQTWMGFGAENTLTYVWNNSSQNTWGWNGGPKIPKNEWAMVAVAIQPDKATAYVYTDADGLKQGINKIPHIQQTIGNINIGWDNFEPGRFFKGIIDEVRIYNRALTEADILYLARNTEVKPKESFVRTTTGPFIPGTGNYKLLPNGSFENGVGVTADNWSGWGDVISRSSEKPYIGNYSLKFDGNLVDGGVAKQLNPPVKVIPNTDYVLSAFVWNGIVEHGNVYLDIVAGVDPLGSYRPRATCGWEQWEFIYIRFRVGHAVTAIAPRVVVDGFKFGVGSKVFFDEVALTPANEFIPPLPQYPPTLPAYNPKNGHYYDVINANLNWFEAKLAAEKLVYKGLQGHLATISSQQEDDFIFNYLPLLNFDSWIGGFQPEGSREPDGNWQWVTGEPFIYARWGPGEPNNSGGVEDGVSFRLVLNWNDIPRLGVLSSFIVEYEPPIQIAKILSITSSVVSPGSRITSRLDINNAAGLTGGDIKLKYDPNIVTILDVRGTKLISGMSIIVNKDTPGEVKIAMAGANPIASGSGALLDIDLQISSNARFGSEYILELHKDSVLYDGLAAPIPVHLKNGILTIGGLKGDVNQDGRVASNDAVLVLRIAAGTMIPTDYQKWAGDMNDDGKVNAADAILILRKAAGQSAPSTFPIVSNDRLINIALEQLQATKGRSIDALIKVDNIDSLAAGDIIVNYDSAYLKATEVKSSSEVLMSSNINTPGVVRISFANIDGLYDNTIASITFDIISADIKQPFIKTAELYSSDALPMNVRILDIEFPAFKPKQTMLFQNYPNPFNPETWIPFHIKDATDVSIRIYDSVGHLVKTLTLGYMEAGFYTAKDKAAYWDGNNEAGEQVSSGIYFYTIQAGDFVATKKMVIAR